MQLLFQRYFGEVVRDNQGDFVQMAGRMQQDPGDSRPGNAVGLSGATGQFPRGRFQVGKGSSPSTRVFDFTTSPCSCFSLPKFKGSQSDSSSALGLFQAGSCSRAPLEQLNTTGMALLLLLLPCQGWQQKGRAGSDGRIKIKDYFHLSLW